MVYAFGDCTLDTRLYALARAGQPLRLRPKAFGVLSYLLAHRDRVVPKDELCAQVWPHQCISEATLESTIRAVRQAIGDSGQAQQMIQTLYGHGYRFIASVTVHDAVPLMEHASAPPSPAQLAARGPSSRPIQAGEQKLVTILCCGVVQGVAPSGPPPLETLHRLLRVLHTLAWPEVQRYAGTLLPLTGDCMLAMFGVPVAHEDHAQRAVLVALALRQRVQTYHAKDTLPSAVPLVVRLGLHTGLVAVEEYAAGAEPATAIVGEPVGVAMTLQARAVPSTIVCSEATARLIRGSVRLKVGEPVLVAGGTPPLRGYCVLGQRVWRTPAIPSDPRQLAPFVGRARELALLQALLEQVEAGQGQVVGIIGEPGLGKSRLVYEFRRSLRGRRLTYLMGSCCSYGQAMPYLPGLTLLRHYWGITAAEPPAASTAKVRRHLAEGGMAPEEWAPYLLRLLDVPMEPDPLATLSRQAIRARTVATLVQMVRQGALRQPLVLVMENLHWIDPSSQEVLAALVERLAGTSILLLTTFRPGYQPPWLDKSYASQVALSRLTPADSRQVVQTNLRTTPVAEALVQAILTKAEGNPFFLEELTRAVVEHNTAQVPLAVMPATVQAVLAARIDRLPPPAKSLLQVAAVIGKDVPRPLLQAVADLPEEALSTQLAQLRIGEFLYEILLEGTPAYTFHHALTQEVAYQSLLTGTRQQYHQRIAQVLGERFPESVETQPALLAHHYSEADLTEQAIPYWQQAGQQALQRSANLEAVAHLTRGLALLATLPDTPARAQQEIDLQLALGPALNATRGRAAPEVEQTYARARVLCEQIGETSQRFLILQGLWQFYVNLGALPTARELGQQLLHLAQREDTLMPHLVAHDTLGTTFFILGEYAAARMHCEQGIALIDPTAERTQALRYGLLPEVRCLAVAALALWCLGYPAQAMRRSQEALALAKTLAHPPSLTFAQHWAALLHHHLREVSAIQEQANALLALATAQEFSLFVGLGTCWQGWARAVQNQDALGLAQLRQGLAAVLATGQTGAQPHWLALLAEAAGHIGQVAEGLHLLPKALTAFEVIGRGDMLTEAYRLQGEFLLRQGIPDTAQAETCFQQALAIARRQQAKSWELRATMSLSRLWQHQGKRAEAHQALAQVYGWFTEGFDTLDLQEAKGLLEALA